MREVKEPKVLVVHLVFLLLSLQSFSWHLLRSSSHPRDRLNYTTANFREDDCYRLLLLSSYFFLSSITQIHSLLESLLLLLVSAATSKETGPLHHFLLLFYRLSLHKTFLCCSGAKRERDRLVHPVLFVSKSTFCLVFSSSSSAGFCFSQASLSLTHKKLSLCRREIEKRKIENIQDTFCIRNLLLLTKTIALHCFHSPKKTFMREREREKEKQSYTHLQQNMQVSLIS